MHATLVDNFGSRRRNALPLVLKYAVVAAILSSVVANAHAQQAQLELVGHRDPVYGVAFTPNGKQIVTASFDHTLRIWDAKTGKSIRTLEGHTRLVLSVAISPDGTTIASGSDDNTIKLWKIQPPKPVGKEKPKQPQPDYYASLSGHRGQIMGLAYSPDGKRLVSSSADKTVRVWDVAGKKLLKTLATHAATVYSVAISPDGKTILTGGADKTVRLYNTETGAEIRSFKGPKHEIYSVAFSPNGQQVAAGGVGLGANRPAYIWNVSAVDPVHIIKGHPDDIYRVEFNTKSQRLLTVGYSGTVNVWDTGSGKNLYRNKLSSVLYSGTLSPDGKRVAVSSNDDKVYLLALPAAAH